MKRARMIIVLMVLSSMCGWVEAAVLNVPAPYSTIQAAIDDSNDGDIVVVASGIYTGLGNKNIDFGGRAITVKSQDGPNACIIDCENDGRGFAFTNNEESSSVLDGFTIKNGHTSGSTPYSRAGAAIYCIGSSPIIRNCFFVSNRAEDYPNAHAGGIYCGRSEAQIKHCIFIDNSCPGYSANGGAILVSGSSQILLFSCLFAGNSSDGGGGAIRTYVDCSVTAINCTFAYNLGYGYYGGAIANTDDSSVGFENCIFWGNNGYEIYNDRNSHALVTNCDIDGGWNGSGIRNSGGSTTTNGGGNIDANPQFVSGPLGEYYLSQIAAGQASNSPCVDSGSDTSAALGLNVYSTRTDNITDAGIVDIGYHYPAANLVGLEINGPNELTEESSTQYKAIAVYDNNNTKDVTNEAVWTVMADDYVDIDESGLLSTYELVMPTERITIYAQYEESNDVFGAEKDVQIFALCPQGGALNFDGIDNFAQIPYIEQYQFQICTIAAWIKPDIGWLEVRPVQFIVGQNEDLVNDRCGPRLYATRPDGGVAFTYENDADTDYVYESSYEPAGGRWTHICATRTSDRVVSLYANGELIQSWSNTGTPATISMAEFRIGSGCNAPPGCGGYFAGMIDEVVMYNASFSTSEIQTLMSNGPLLTDPNLIAYWDFEEGQGQIAHDSSVYGNNSYLGSDPCNPDSADPCWVEPGAPIPCTLEGFVEKHLDRALDKKLSALELIAEAIEDEWTAQNALEVYFDNRDFGNSNKSDVVKAKQRIHQAIGNEEQAEDSVERSVEDLQDSMDSLGIE